MHLDTAKCPHLLNSSSGRSLLESFAPSRLCILKVLVRQKDVRHTNTYNVIPPTETRCGAWSAVQEFRESEFEESSLQPTGKGVSTTTCRMIIDNSVSDTRMRQATCVQKYKQRVCPARVIAE